MRDNKIWFLAQAPQDLVHQAQLMADVCELTDIKHVITHVAKTGTTPQVLLINLKSICGHNNMTVFEVIHMLHAMLQTVNNQTSVMLAVWVDAQSDATHVKQVVEAQIAGLVPTPSWWGSEATQQALHELMQGHSHVPRKILDTLRSNKKPKVKSRSQIPSLTPRQTQVMNLITSRGASNKVIARSLKISESTVKVHIGAILKKYGVRNRTQLALCGVNGKLS